MIRSPPLGALKSEPPISGSILVLSQLSAAARSPLWPLWLSSGTIKEKSGRVWLARSAENCEKGTRLFAFAGLSRSRKNRKRGYGAERNHRCPRRYTRQTEGLLNIPSRFSLPV